MQTAESLGHNENRPEARASSGVPRALLRRYRQYLRLERSFSDNTLDAYMRDLDKLLRYYEAEGVDFRAVTIDQLHTFVATLMDIGITTRSISRILSGVHAFYRFLELEGEVPTDPTELLDSPQRGVIIPPMVWCRLHNFAPDTVCLTLASGDYDAQGYINDFNIFKSIAQHD